VGKKAKTSFPLEVPGVLSNKKKSRHVGQLQVADQIALLTLSAEKAQLTTEIAGAKQKLKRYRQLTDSHNHRIKELEQTKADLESKVNTIQKQVDELKRRDLESSRILKALQRTNEKNSQKLEVTKKKLEKKVASLSTQREKIQGKRREINMLKSRYAESVAFVDEVKAKAEKLERRSSVVAERAIQSERELDRERRSMLKLQDEFTRTRTSVTALQIQTDTLAGEVARKQEELQRKQDEMLPGRYSPDQLRLMETLREQIKLNFSNVQKMTDCIRSKKQHLDSLRKRERRYNKLTSKAGYNKLTSSRPVE